MSDDAASSGTPWTIDEVETIVTGYFQMLRMQELEQKPNKAEQNRRLKALLPARNLASIEYKHRNISAVLLRLGAQPLLGTSHFPTFNVCCWESVEELFSYPDTLNEAAMHRVEMPAAMPSLKDFRDFVVDPPNPPAPKTLGEVRNLRTPTRRDYLEREARNRSLGLAGELLIMEYESHRLRSLGANRFAERVEHVSRTRGDAVCGFDILSFDQSGQERFIEVKTTAYVAETPFFVSPNEVQFS